MAKVLSVAPSSSAIFIRPEGTQEAAFPASQTKSASSGPLLGYRDGERIRFAGRSGNYQTIVVDSPTESKMITFPFVKCVDADDNHYPVVRIGNRFWMAANLKTTRYRNGDPIPELQEAQAWSATRAGALSNFGNSPARAGEYGRLYNWYALTDARSLAPAGWRLPSYLEAVALAQSLVGGEAVGGKLKETGTARWFSPNTGAGNSTGFTARPGGYRTTEGAFYNLGYQGYWWCPSPYDSIRSYAFGLRHDSDSLQFYIGLKNYGMSVRCILDDQETTERENMETGKRQEALTATLSVMGGSAVVPTQGSPVDGLKITLPAHAFPSEQTLNVSWSDIRSHDFGKFFNPLTPLIGISYSGGYADSLIHIEVPVTIPEGHFAMGFLYNEATGELEGMPLLSCTGHSVVVASRHFSTSAMTGPAGRRRLKSGTGSQAVTDSGYFVISSIALEELKKQTDIVSDFEPGYDDWEFTNFGSIVSPSGICSGMCLSALWYFSEERLNGSSQLYHKYDKATLANAAALWQDNSTGIKLASMVHYDYATADGTYESAIDQIARDKTKDSLSWYAFAYSILQTRQPQFIGIMSSTGGGHVLIANQLWFQNGELWISDPNHPGNRSLSIHYIDHEFEPYYASLDADANPKNFEFIAYYGKSAVVDWNRVTQRWAEAEEGTIGREFFPEKKLLAYNPTNTIEFWNLENDFTTSLDTLLLYIKDNPSADYAFAVYDAEGFQILPADKKYAMDYFGKIGLSPGLNILGVCIYKKTTSADKEGNIKTSWDWAGFQWVDVYQSRLQISPDPIVSVRPDKELTLTVVNSGNPPVDARYEWDFGDGSAKATVYNDNTVKHHFTRTGIMEVIVRMYNNQTGVLAGSAKTKAKIGVGSFTVWLSADHWYTCQNPDGVIFTQTGGIGYELMVYGLFTVPPAVSMVGSGVNASWDGTYDWRTYNAKFNRKGTAAFQINSRYDSLSFTLTDEWRETPLLALKSRIITLTGKLPLIREDANGLLFGVNEVPLASFPCTLHQITVGSTGQTCESNAFSDYRNHSMTISLGPASP